MPSETPIVTADEVFAVSKKIRWVALTTDKGEVVLNKMRPNVRSCTPEQVDEEFVTLGPLTMLGVAEKFSECLEGVESVVVWYGLMAHALFAVRISGHISLHRERGRVRVSGPCLACEEAITARREAAGRIDRPIRCPQSRLTNDVGTSRGRRKFTLGNPTNKPSNVEYQSAPSSAFAVHPPSVG